MSSSLDDIRLKLETEAFELLKTHGFVTLRGQVRLSLRINSRVSSTEIAAEDWEELLKNELSETERKVIEAWRASNNAPLSLSNYFSNYLDARAFKNFIRSHCYPLYVADCKGQYCIKKILM